MSGPDPQWQERCDRYFSSMLDANHTETTGSKSHSKGRKKRIKKERKYKVKNENGFQRFGESPPPLPTHHMRHHVTTFTPKAEPLKGPIRWLSVLDFHGTSMLMRARSILYCLFWITTSLLAFIVFGVFVFIFVSDYLDDATRFKVRVSHESGTPSPLSLVLCNVNLLRMSTLSPGSRFNGLKNLTVFSSSSGQPVPTQTSTELLDSTKLEEFLKYVNLGREDLPLTDLQAEFALYSRMVSDSDWDTVARAAIQLNFDPLPRALRLTAQEMRSFGPDSKSDVLQCSKNGRQCRSGELTSELHRDLGNCAVVNLSLEDSWFSTAHLTLDVTKEEYIPGASPDPPGFHVLLRTSSDTSPVSPGQAVFVAAGEAMELSLRKVREVNRLGKDGGCESDITYSRTTCERQCLELHAARVCGCSLGLDNTLAQRCRVSVQYEFLCYRILEILAHEKKVPCECKPTCREEYVQVSASSYPWITEQSQIKLRQSLAALGVNRNFTDFSKSLSKIKVRVISGDYEKLEEEQELSLLQLLMNLGAISALTCGVSVVTAVELIWIFGKSLSAMCCAVIKKEQRDEDKVEFLPPPSMIRPTHLHEHPNTYRWVAYTGNGPPYPLHNQTEGHGEMAPAIFMMPPPPGDYPGAQPDQFYTHHGARNFYLRGQNLQGHGHGHVENGGQGYENNSNNGSPGPQIPHDPNNDAGLNVVEDEVLEDSETGTSPRMGVNAPAALFSHPWERPGRHEPHRTVLNTSQPGEEPAGMPLFNVPIPPPPPPPPPPPAGSNVNNLDDDLRLHGLDTLNPSSSSSDEDGFVAPRSTSPLYRVDRGFGPRVPSDVRTAQKMDARNSNKPSTISGGGIPKQATISGPDTTGAARPDGPGVEPPISRDSPGQIANRNKKTAWAENIRQPIGHTGQDNKRNKMSESNKIPTALTNGHTRSNGLVERQQFFPRTTPIQPNTWYVPEFQRMEFYDGRHSKVQHGAGPAYFMYQEGVNGHI